MEQEMMGGSGVRWTMYANHLRLVPGR